MVHRRHQHLFPWLQGDQARPKHMVFPKFKGCLAKVADKCLQGGGVVAVWGTINLLQLPLTRGKYELVTLPLAFPDHRTQHLMAVYHRPESLLQRRNIK